MLNLYKSSSYKYYREQLFYGILNEVISDKTLIFISQPILQFQKFNYLNGIVVASKMNAFQLSKFTIRTQIIALN